jgi:hypothetical protein
VQNNRSYGLFDWGQIYPLELFDTLLYYFQQLLL